MSASLALASVGLLVGPQQEDEAATPKIKIYYIGFCEGDAASGRPQSRVS